MPEKRRSEKTPFTEKRVRSFDMPADGAERVYYYDANTPGLAVCVFSSGARVYYLYKKVDGKPVRIRLGNIDELSLDNARDAAQARLGEIAKGQNPHEEKRQRAQQRKMTLGALWSFYLENHAKPKKRSWLEDQQRYDRHVKQWADRPLTSITAADVELLLNQVRAGSHCDALKRKRKKRGGPYEANRLRSLLHKMFALAPKIGYRGTNPVAGVDKFPEESRARFLQADELPAFFKALADLRNESPVAADAIEVALWTGARRGNVMAMRWEELVLQRAEWTIPGSKFKNGKPMTVHLPEPAMAVLLARLRIRGDSPFVFPGRRHGKPLQDPYKPWRALLAASGLKELRPHDLRRTMGSWQTATGANIQVVAKTLGHRDLASTAVYARLNLEPVRTAVNKAVEAIQAAAKSQETETTTNGK